MDYRVAPSTTTAAQFRHKIETRGVAACATPLLLAWWRKDGAHAPPNLQTGTPSRFALSARLSRIPVPGKCMTPIGRSSSIASLPLNGAALACFVQSGLKAILRHLAVVAHLEAISSAPFGEARDLTREGLGFSGFKGNDLPRLPYRCVHVLRGWTKVLAEGTGRTDMAYYAPADYRKYQPTCAAKADNRVLQTARPWRLARKTGRAGGQFLVTSDSATVLAYNSEFRGFANYYSFADDKNAPWECWSLLCSAASSRRWRCDIERREQDHGPSCGKARITRLLL